MMLFFTLFFCDYRYHCFDILRHKSSAIIMSIQYVVNYPLRLMQTWMINFSSKQTVLKQNAQLNANLLLASVKLQRLEFLEQENSQLRTLLNYTKPVKNKILPAELLTSATNKFVQQITLDKGSKQGVYIGQPVLDAHGLFGQVVMVRSDTSTVMLLTNSKSAVPVMVVRNGLHAIAVGTGNNNYLELANVPETADIKIGDCVVTSGLERIFPAGYRVGVVKDIKRIFGERFLKVFILPEAHLDRSLHVFLIWSKSGEK